jgi:predicted NBD/HSP70 family sugar kinase
MSRLTEPVRLEDAVANRVLGDAKRLIGRVLADMVNNLNPGVVVRDGELALAGESVLVGVQDSLGAGA